MVRMLRMPLLTAVLVAGLGWGGPVGAASLQGVNVPEHEMMDGTQLRLNGIGLRTVSVFQIDVYVAGLFLEEPTTDATSILKSPRKKVLVMTFLRELSADKARQAWNEAFERTCRAPCQLAKATVDQFLAAVPDMRKGDVVKFQFSVNTLRVMVNGRELGVIHDPVFEQTVLASFIGPAPTSTSLKKGLLGLGE